MKNIFLALFVLMLTVDIGYSQVLSTTENYIFEKFPMKAYSNLEGATDIIKKVTYLDGLGSVKQQILINGNNQGNDIVNHYELDDAGRTAIRYLPFTGSQNGAFYANGAQQVQNYSQYSGETPYSVTIFDNSPLNRVVEQGNVGNDWQPGQHSIKESIYFNTAVISTYKYITSTSTYSVFNYPVGTVLITETTDENGVIIKNYNDNNGLNLFVDIDGKLTLNIYYDFNRLHAIIPPEAHGDYTKDEFNYYFFYNAKGLVVEKHVPGMDGNIELVYDGRNRLIEEHFPNGKKVYYEYTNNNRISKSGIIVNNNKICLLEKYYDYVYIIDFSYSYPNSIANPLGKETGGKYLIEETGQWIKYSVFYDEKGRQLLLISENKFNGFDYKTFEYTFDGKVINENTRITGTVTNEYNKRFEFYPNGIVKNVFVKLDNEPEFLLDMAHYDEFNVLNNKKVNNNYSIDYNKNIRGWFTNINSPYFNEELVYNNSNSSASNSPLYNGNISSIEWSTSNVSSQQINYSYDNLNRLSSSISANQDQDEELTYDDNGNILTLKRTGTGSALINDFEYTYNGNKLISLKRNTETFEGLWPGDANNDGHVDQSDVLAIQAYLNQKVVPRADDGSIWAKYTIIYTGNMAIYADCNGDGLVDSHDISIINMHFGLTHVVVSNGQIVDTQYEYDENGNMTEDNYKNMTIEYNHMNLPIEITVLNVGKIHNIYSPHGILLSKSKYNENNILLSTTYYCGYFQYEKLAGAAIAVKYIFNDEGYTTIDNGEYNNHFIIKDHLGNTRILLDKDFQIEGEFAYYSFGEKVDHLSYECGFDYLYNGKQLITDFKLDIYDYGFRLYDAKIGRFQVVDPIFSNNFSSSPYSYAANNPILFIDKLGLSPDYTTMSPEQWMQYSNPYYSRDARSRMEKEFKSQYWKLTGEGYKQDFTGRWYKWESSTSEYGSNMGFITDGYKISQVSGVEITERKVYYNPGGGGANFDNSNLALDIGGGIYGGLRTAVTPGDQWLGNNGKYYNKSYGGNQYTGSRSGAIAASNTYKWAGRATVGATAIIGGIQVYNGYQMDGGQFGYNANLAGAGATGGIIGGWAGAEAGATVGAAIGVWFGGVGAVPGAIIGGFVGGIAGSLTGNKIGEASVNYYYGR